MGAIRETGLRIPGDISVCGFDDIDVAAEAHPPLTTVSVDKEKLGELAVEMLVRRMEEPDSFTQRITLPTEPVIRASVAAIE